MKIKGRKSKKCPRCGNECLLSQVKCDECGLLFEKVEKATNKEGKRRLYRRQKEQVIYVKKYPSDVKKWKMILITIFFGLFGAHYFYIGKWKKGLAMLIYFFIVLFIGVIFNAYFLLAWSGNFFSIFGPLTGVYTLIWMFDIYRVSFNKFKVPVSIISEEEEKEYQDQKALLKEIKAKRREEKRNKNTQNIELIENSELEKEIVINNSEEKNNDIKVEEGEKK